MKPFPDRFRQALGFTLAAALAGAAALAALRVARSMRLGRDAVFSVDRAAAPARALSVDLIARAADARVSGPPPGEAWESLLRCPGPAPTREREGGRLLAVALPEEGGAVCRRALHVPAGGRAEFSLVVPASAALVFTAGARASAAGALEMTVDVSAGGRAPEAVEVRREELAPGRLDVPWRRVEADLSPWAGRSVTLRFGAAFRPAVEGSSAAAHAFWASAALWTPAPEDGARRASAVRAGPPVPRSAVWVVFESFPLPSLQGLSTNDFSGLDLLAREGVEFQRVYGNHPDAEEGLRRLLTSRVPEAPGRPGAAEKPLVAWPVLLEAAGTRVILFGAPGRDLGRWCALGFAEARAAPPAGDGGEAALAEAARWMARNGRSGPHALVVFVRAPRPGEDPSPRCWLRAARLSPLSFFRGGRARALAQAVQADGALRRLWSQKLHLGDEDRTLFIVSSLRGPSFRAEPLRRSSDGRLIRRPLPGAGLGLREEEVRALWIMRAPGLASGRKVTTPAQLLDAAPTALQLMGLSPDGSWEGRSFARPDARLKPEEEDPRFLIEGPGGRVLVLDGHYKYVRRAGRRELMVDGALARTDFEPEELYDLWADPGEERNLARRRRDLLARARRAVNEWAPERTATLLKFQGFVDPPLQGVVRCPNGDLWNVTLSTGELTRSGTVQASFVLSAPEAVFSFETWPPHAPFTLSLRSGGRSVPADAFTLSRLGLPLVEPESWNEWFDRNKFPWMEGVPEAPPPGPRRRALMGRSPAERGTP